MRDAMAEAKASDLHHLACADIILSFIELEHKNLMRELNHQDLWGSSQNFKLLILMYGHMGTMQYLLRIVSCPHGDSNQQRPWAP